MSVLATGFPVDHAEVGRDRKTNPALTDCGLGREGERQAKDLDLEAEVVPRRKSQATERESRLKWSSPNVHDIPKIRAESTRQHHYKS